MELSDMNHVRIGALAMGPEAEQVGFIHDIHFLRDQFASLPIESEPPMPGFSFEIAGRFDPEPSVTNLGRTYVRRSGQCSAEINVSLETLKMPIQERRAEIARLMVTGSEKLGVRMKKKWPEYDVDRYLKVVRVACESLKRLSSTPPRWGGSSEPRASD